MGTAIKHPAPEQVKPVVMRREGHGRRPGLSDVTVFLFSASNARYTKHTKDVLSVRPSSSVSSQLDSFLLLLLLLPGAAGATNTFNLPIGHTHYKPTFVIFDIQAL